MLQLTIFKNVFDNETDRTMNFQSWSDLVRLLTKLSKIPGYKPVKDVPIPAGVTPSPLISPAIYRKGTTRAIKNVVGWAGWACIDVDDYEDTFDEVRGKFLGYSHVLYSTASSKIEHPKFRVVFLLTRSIHVEEIAHFWFALNAEFGNIVDQQTKDSTRMFYVPAQYPNAYNFLHIHEGKPIDPAILMGKHPFVKKAKSIYDLVSDDLKKEMFAHQRKKYTNTDIRWTSYRDCPFVSKKMLTEYRGLSANWYAKSYKMMCAIACRALKMNYPINANEVAQLFRSIDQDTGNWYANRPIELEAERALEYAMRVT